MKLDQLRKIIREEVRAAVKEELQDMLNEAVKVASAPEQTQNSYRQVKQNDLKRTWSVGKMNSGTVPLEEMLQQTAKNMTGEEYRNIFNGNADMVQKPNFASSMASQMGMTESSGPAPGLDISNLKFVKNAKAILDKSYEKDKRTL